MMRFILSFLTLGAAAANLPIYGNPNSHQQQLTIDNVMADSPLGNRLLSHARRLQNDNGLDMSWVADYSIKFQGCHHVSQWNDEAVEDDQVRIQTKRLIRFRLCPSDYCSLNSSSGCSSGYGDYIIDMNTFLQVYYDAVDEQNQYMCQNLQNNVCQCVDDGADDYNEEMCLYSCYQAQGVANVCADRDPYAEEGQGQEVFQLKDYVECRQIEINYGRRLDENAEEGDAQENQEQAEDQQQEEQQQQNQNYQNNGMEYFIGPYCVEQGGAINLGLFLDDTCTSFADKKGGAYTYQSLTGENLPYSSQSIITNDCMSCQEVDNGNNENNNNNNNNAYGVSEICAQIYDEAGKCESSLQSSGVVDEPNENACNYIKGIKVVRKDGIITQVGSKANKTASIFIGIFVVAFVLLAAYVYYLKTKLDRVSINLAE